MNRYPKHGSVSSASRAVGMAVLFMALLLPLPGVAFAEGGGAPAPGMEAAEVFPSDVMTEVQWFSRRLSRLGTYMGIKAAPDLGILVSHASPRDLYFQALALFDKTNRFSFEVLGYKRNAPPLPIGHFQSEDVGRLVRAALELLSGLENRFGLAPEAVGAGRNWSTSTTIDVFMAVQQANRHVNLFLEKPFAPSDVYQEVNLAIGYGARLLAKYPGIRRIPEKPLYEPGKKPWDVFLRLQTCLGIINQIAVESRQNQLSIDLSALVADAITPGDVYDLAALVVARLDMLHEKFKCTEMPRKTYYPGKKIPADVYQQLGILQKQLSALLSLLRTQGMSNNRQTSSITPSPPMRVVSGTGRTDSPGRMNQSKTPAAFYGPRVAWIVQPWRTVTNHQAVEQE